MTMRRSTLPAVVLCSTLAAACGHRPSDLPPDLDARVASADARARGAALYQQDCALCHGEHGDGRGARLSAFTTPPRDFTNAAWRGSATPAHVFRAIRDGLPGTPMASWRHLGDDQLADLTAYVLELGAPR